MMKKFLAIIGFPLIIFGAFRALPHMLMGDANAAKRASGDFLLIGIILVVIWLILDIYYSNKSKKKK